MFRAITAALIGFLLHGALQAMEFTQTGAGLKLSGTIRSGDYERLLEHYRRAPERFVTNQTFRLDSDGGNVLEAIKIAHFVRSTLRVTMVTHEDRCLSSCFFILVAGGARFTADARVGVHRPYYAPNEFAALGPSQARDAYARADTEVRKFLSEMRVSDDVVREMFATPSSDIKLLTENEFKRRLGEAQPWFEELAKSACPSSPLEQLRCMGLKSAVDRVELVERYLGPAAEAVIRQWTRNYRQWAVGELAKLAPTQPGSTQPESRTARVETAQGKLYLSCAVSWSTGPPAPDTLDFVVDFDRGLVGSRPAEITEESIGFASNLEGRKSMTRINRRSGAISIFMEGLGTMVGNCRHSGERKF